MQRFIVVLWLIGLVVSSIGFLWAVFHNFVDISITLLIVNVVLSLACWLIARKRARRRARWAAYLRRYQS